MFDLSLSKLALIGVVALVVVGPEKLPKVARTAGTLLGRARRYLNDVKAEVGREMALDDLHLLRQDMATAVRDLEGSIGASPAGIAAARELSPADADFVLKARNFRRAKKTLQRQHRQRSLKRLHKP